MLIVNVFISNEGLGVVCVLDGIDCWLGLGFRV